MAASKLAPLEFHIDCSQQDLQVALHTAISALAGERGLAVEKTVLSLSAESPRRVAFRLACEVRAMIVSGTIVVAGRAEIGDDLCARILDLAVEKTGMLSNLAAAAIEPKLATVRGMSLRLAELKIPGLVVRDVRLAVDERVRLTVRLAPAG